MERSVVSPSLVFSQTPQKDSFERKVFPDKGLSNSLHSSYPHTRQDVVSSDIFVNNISTPRKFNTRQNPT